MNCPYCGEEMFRGFIYRPVYSSRGYNYAPSMQWYPEGENANKYVVDLTVDHHETAVDHVETFYCYDCKKMVVDLEAIELKRAEIMQEREEKEAQMKTGKESLKERLPGLYF